MRTPKFKVYALNWCGKSRRIVAATSTNKAAEIFGVSKHEMRTHGSKTENREEVTLAMSEPGAVWERSYRSGSHFERVPTWCAWCGKMTDHGSGSCPDLRARTNSNQST